MGQEIATSHFNSADFIEFQRRLEQEMVLLRGYFSESRFGGQGNVAGFELEAWLVDPLGQPQPKNVEFLTQLNNPEVVAELSRFNIELNTEPRQLKTNILSEMAADLNKTWQQCNRVASKFDCSLVMIGTLPTIKDSQLTLTNMSPAKRYRALNEQVLRLRGGQPLRLDIDGHDHVHMSHGDLMFESAATSFQVHLQTPFEFASRYYNAAHIASAPIVAVSANSPYLFGRDLWDETRIPLFEQAVDLAGSSQDECGGHGRVTFGAAYVKTSLLECFERNQRCYHVLLPTLLDDTTESLAHIRLHNGTVWRWNRPLIGFSADGEPRIRLEHRVIPAGPTILDTIANAALFFGIVEMLAQQDQAPESLLDFEQARRNFYQAAQHGLRAQIQWIDGKTYPINTLLQQQLLPLAHQGLERLQINPEDRQRFLNIIEARLNNGQNGANWQRAYIAKHGQDFAALTRAYRTRQEAGEPVHQWSL